MKRIHVTDRKVWKRCRRRYSWEKEGLRKPSDKFSGALWFGTGIHEALARQSLEGIDPVVAWIEFCGKSLVSSMYCPEFDRDKFFADQDLGTSMLSRYSFWEETQEPYKILGTEVELEIKIPGTNVILVGTVDRIIEYRGRTWVVDHKTATTMPKIEELELDDQMTAYIYMMSKLGYNPAGAIYNVLRKKIPDTPQVLTKGGLSTRKSIDTTYAIYLDAIHKIGARTEDYFEILERLQKNKFFTREEIYRSKIMLDNFERYLLSEAREMTSIRTIEFPNMTRDCVWDCPYLPLCRCVNDGGDIELLKESLYEIGEVRK